MGATVLSMNEFVTLDTMHCGECGVTFAMPRGLREQRIRDRKSFFCPNGHERYFCGEREEDRLRRELEQSKAAHLRTEKLREAASTQAQHHLTEWRKAQTRLRNTQARIKNGVCPCCHRSFVQLARHMATKHPNFQPEARAE